MSTTIEPRHLTDAELVGILDGEAVEPRPGRTDHLEACGECTGALHALETDSRLVREFLEAADFEEGGPPRRSTEPWRGAAAGSAGWRRRSLASTSPWLKAAAILVLVAGPLAAFPGVRTWVAEQITGSPDGASTAAEVGVDAATVIRFTPNAGDFVVTFEPGTTGTILIDRIPGTEAELHAAGGDPETVVSASSLEIRNGRDGRYELLLPASVTGLWVRVGERAVAVSDTQIDRRAVVELGRRPTLR